MLRKCLRNIVFAMQDIYTLVPDKHITDNLNVFFFSTKVNDKYVSNLNAFSFFSTKVIHKYVSSYPAQLMGSLAQTQHLGDASVKDRADILLVNGLTLFQPRLIIDICLLILHSLWVRSLRHRI